MALKAQNTTQKSISIAFCVSSIRHDSSLSKYRKQKQSPPWTCAIFSISRGGLEFAHAASSGVELMLSFQSIIAITKFLSIINLSLFFELMAYVYL
jgi:hypothetical protein